MTDSRISIRSKLIGLALLPLLLVAVYWLYASVQARIRYDQDYFSPHYQELYAAPGVVAMELERALQSGDSAALHELQGLRRAPKDIEPNPTIRFAILVEIDEAGYFHYLYFDSRTFLRSTYFVKDVGGRWVAAPEDLYFYWDSGMWLGVFLPIAIVWWLILLVVAIARFLFTHAHKYRRNTMGST